MIYKIFPLGQEKLANIPMSRHTWRKPDFQPLTSTSFVLWLSLLTRSVWEVVVGHSVKVMSVCVPVHSTTLEVQDSISWFMMNIYLTGSHCGTGTEWGNCHGCMVCPLVVKGLILISGPFVYSFLLPLASFPHFYKRRKKKKHHLKL